MTGEGIVTVLFVPTLTSVADLFTKHLTGARIRFLLGLMGAYIVQVASGEKADSQVGISERGGSIYSMLTTIIAIVVAALCFCL